MYRRRPFAAVTYIRVATCASCRSHRCPANSTHSCFLGQVGSRHIRYRDVNEIGSHRQPGRGREKRKQQMRCLAEDGNDSETDRRSDRRNVALQSGPCALEASPCDLRVHTTQSERDIGRERPPLPETLASSMVPLRARPTPSAWSDEQRTAAVPLSHSTGR